MALGCFAVGPSVDRTFKMKYFIAILIILAVFGGYCLGTLDKKPVEANYQAPMNLDLVILNMTIARDSHQRYADDPDLRYWDLYTEEQQREWVRLYDMTIEILESLR